MTTRRPRPSPDRADLESVRDRLAPLVAALDEILTLLDEGCSLNLVGPTKQTIHERYRTVKRALEAAYRRGDTAHGRDALTPAESAFWQPNVHQAFTELDAPVTSTNRAALRESVSAALGTLRPALHDLEDEIARVVAVGRLASTLERLRLAVEAVDLETAPLQDRVLSAWLTAGVLHDEDFPTGPLRDRFTSLRAAMPPHGARPTAALARTVAQGLRHLLAEARRTVAAAEAEARG